MDEKQAYERVTAEYERRVRSDSRLEAFRRKLAAGGTNGVSAITLKDAHAYVDRLAQIFGECFGRAVLDIAQGEREGTCMRLMRDRVTDIDEVSEGAQSAVLARQGLNISPKPEAYPEKRIFTLAHSLEDPTATDEQIVRRADSASATVMRSRFDENMKKGARTCASAGLKTYIVRDGSSKCCEWCAGLAGRYSYGSEPKDVYRRHDNCSCSVVYESGRGRQNVWSKQYWSAEQEREYLRLRDEMAPKRLNARQAQALRERVGGLTFGRYSDILSLSDSSSIYDFVSDRAASNAPYLDIFGERGETSYQKRIEAATLNVLHKQASSDLLRYIRADEQACLANDPNYEPGVEYSIVYDENMKPIKGREKPDKYVQGRCEIQSPGVPFHAFHNHGSSETLGIADLSGFSVNDDMKSISAQGNNGKNKFTLFKAENYDKAGYNDYISEMQDQSVFKIGERNITLRDCNDEKQRKEINNLYNSLSDDEKASFKKALLEKTKECLRGGEKFGVKYIFSKA